MVIETKPETDSQADPDVLAKAAAAASEQQESGAAVAETQPLGTGEVEKQPVALSLEELEAKLDKEGLTPDEGKQLKAHQKQREEWTARQYQAQRDQEREAGVMAQVEAQRVADLQKAGDQYLARLDEIEDAEVTRAGNRGVEPDWTHIRERRATAFDDLMAKTQELHVGPIEHSLREAILTLTYPDGTKLYGNTPQNRRVLQGKGMGELLTEYGSAAYKIGQRAGPGADQVVLSKGELEKREKAAAKEALDDYLAKHPEAGASTRTRAGETSSGLPTVSEWQSWTLERREEARRKDPAIETKMMGLV